MKENLNKGNEPALVCPGHLGERFNNQVDLAKLFGDIELPDLPKLEYLAFSPSAEEGDLEDVRAALQRYLDVVRPFKQFLRDPNVVDKAESLLAVISGLSAADRLDDAASALNNVIRRTGVKVALREENLPPSEY